MKNKNNTFILILFLLGIFMGAIDSGIISPAREIIENTFGVSRNVGMWMITIYTLFYAVSMPIVSKLSDRYGHKKIYTISIFLFGTGSLLCGLNNFYGNFGLFLGARIIQAIGAGGIMPIANTVIGLSFPKEKRGLALGMVGAVYGVATIVGPTLGSTILGISGSQHWGWIFFINIPISLAIILLTFIMKNTKKERLQPMDLLGSIVLAVTIGSVMYALTNMDFFHLGTSIKDITVYPFLLIFILLLPLLVYVESKAKDPVLNLKYFRNREMIVIFILAFIVGIGMMGMVFVPQFAENVLRIKAGTGGYLVTLLAVFSGIAAPLSGKLLDKKGTRFVMGFGFMFTILGTIILGYVATKYLNFGTILLGLSLMGFGVGFSLGAPLNYLVLQSVPETQGATALATMSLIRSIGVSISPSFMIGFIVDAAKNLQPKLMGISQQSLSSIMPEGMSMPVNSGGTNSKLFESLQSADVTSIVDKLKEIFGKIISSNPKIPSFVAGMVTDTIEKSRNSLENAYQSTLNSGYTNMFTAAAIIAGIGFITAFFLKKRRKSPCQHS